MLQRSVVELVPGIAVATDDPPPELPSTLRCLLAGRAEDEDLKGLDIAATAFGRLPPAPVRNQAQLIVQGALIEEADDLADRLAVMAGSRRKVHVAPYTEHPQQLALELGRATLAIMPSRIEGFGLTGLEAIRAGVPALVSANSGLGELLIDIGGAAAACVVEVDDDLEADAARWSERITQVFDDRPAAFELAAEVRMLVAERCAWETTAATLLDALELEPTSHTVSGGEGQAEAKPMALSLPERNLSFSGRAELLTQLDDAVQAETAGSIQVLVGPAGVGKTQVATELAWRRRALYDVVWTLNAANSSAVAADLASLARELTLVEAGASQDVQAQAARRWLAENAGWLLVADDAEGPELLVDWLPEQPVGDVVITSRTNPWEGAGDVTFVGPWSRKESVTFLLTRTGDPDPESADLLAEALGDMPLALSLAASYLDERASGIEDYLKQLRDDAPMLFASEARDPAQAVDISLRLAHEELAEEPLTLEFVNLAAFYGPERIPRELLRAFLDLRGSDRMEGDLTVEDRAIASSVRFAQMLKQQGGLTLHPELAERTRVRLGEQAGLWAAQACQTIWDTISPADRAAKIELLPHALAATRYAMAVELPVEIGGEIYATIVVLRLTTAQLLIDTGHPDAAAATLVEVADFLADNTVDPDELDPVLSIAVALARSAIATPDRRPDPAGQQYEHALKLARDAGIKPAAAADLVCQLLLDVLPGDPAADGAEPWYAALGFRALQASAQVLDSRQDSAVPPDPAAVEVRLRILRYCILCEHLDDGVAVADKLLMNPAIAETARAQAAELQVQALEALGDLDAAEAVRQMRFPQP